MNQRGGSVDVIDDAGNGYSGIRRAESWNDIHMLDAEADPALADTGSVSNVANEVSSYAEDVLIVYMEAKFPCDIQVLRQGSGFFRKALEGLDGIEAKVTPPPCFPIPT